LFQKSGTDFPSENRGAQDCAHGPIAERKMMPFLLLIEPALRFRRISAESEQVVVFADGIVQIHARYP